MPRKYNPQEVEAKWQQVWAETGLYQTRQDKGKENYYCLVMFPYPSGDLHAGHWYNFGPADTFARYQLMQGKNVLHPIGFDAFGLPAENAAISNNIPPAKWTAANIERMTTQLKSLGTMYDWERVVNTADPDYYQWTQWLFLLLYENGLAYRAKGWQNWCPKDQTVLANEQVVGESRVCERCGTPVEKKELEQWFFKITDYAERLLNDLDQLQWPERVKTMQANWIGKSEGAELTFKLQGIGSPAAGGDDKHKVKVFTTRPDTLGGATFVVISPELAGSWLEVGWQAAAAVKQYVTNSLNRTEIERQDQERTKTGVDTGITAVNPLTGAKVPVWVADYVLGGYGTGAIMAVPAHDERDNQFAKAFDLPITKALQSDEELFTGDAPLVNSGKYDGLVGAEARRAIVEDLYRAGTAKHHTQYRLRDWLISRQRYWGPPIPIIYCDKCGIVPVPADQLPVELPLDVEFAPTGKSPLADRPDFYETKCPQCGGAARRETDTLDTFVDSSWYFLRYPNNKYAEAAFDPAAVKAWLPVDQYIGGVEHAILHLLYSRFITKVLADQKLIEFNEPFQRLYNQGIILGPDGQKMSKSRGNVVNPDDWVGKYGADTFRMYLMFMGPYDQGGPFDTKGIAGIYRYLVRVWELVQQFTASGAEADADGSTGTVATDIERITHQTIKRVGDHLQQFRFNLALSSLMEGLNQLQALRRDPPAGGFVPKASWAGALQNYLLLLAPFAPHLAEELWKDLGQAESIFTQAWPQYDPELLREELMTIVVQVNGKVRATLQVASDTTEAEIVQQAEALEAVQKYLDGKPAQTISVPRRLVNFVTK